MSGSIKVFALIFAVAVATSGCVNVATSKVDPSVNLASLKTMYVQHYESDNSGVSVEIANQLATRGAKVTTGNGPAPQGVDAIVMYEDHWRWDITMYMLSLTVRIKDPLTKRVLASGESLHTSLTRKSQTEMVTEVINNIYAGQPIVAPNSKALVQPVAAPSTN